MININKRVANDICGMFVDEYLEEVNRPTGIFVRGGETQTQS